MVVSSAGESRPGLVEHLVRHAELAEVVEQRGDLQRHWRRAELPARLGEVQRERGDAAGVPRGEGALAVDGLRKEERQPARLGAGQLVGLVLAGEKEQLTAGAAQHLERVVAVQHLARGVDEVGREEVRPRAEEPLFDDAPERRRGQRRRRRLEHVDPIGEEDQVRQPRGAGLDARQLRPRRVVKVHHLGEVRERPEPAQQPRPRSRVVI